MTDRFYAAVVEYESIREAIAHCERGAGADAAKVLTERYQPILDLVQEFTDRYDQAKALAQGVAPRGG